MGTKAVMFVILVVGLLSLAASGCGSSSGGSACTSVYGDGLVDGALVVTKTSLSPPPGGTITTRSTNQNLLVTYVQTATPLPSCQSVYVTKVTAGLLYDSSFSVGSWSLVAYR